MLVSEFFKSDKITRQDLWNIQDESEYWEKAGLFVLDNWESDMDKDLTDKQLKWVIKIQEDMVYRRIKAQKGVRP